MNEIDQWLKQYGLNETERIVYMCILQNPHIKAGDIQRHTLLVRTTIYYCLAELKNKGLLTENFENNVKSYKANSPSVLTVSIESVIEKQQRMLNQLEEIDSQVTHINSKSGVNNGSHIDRLEGEVAIKQAIETAFRCNSKHWDVIASHDNFLSHTSKKYKKYYLDERKRRGIQAKTLWEPHDGIKSPSLSDIVFRNPRVLPNSFAGNFNSLVIIYDDVTLMIDPYDHLTGHAIHDASATNLLHLLFTSIWDSADKVTPAQ